MPTKLQWFGIVLIFAGSILGTVYDTSVLYYAASAAWIGVLLVWRGERK
jgi:hypothetical protein